MNTYVAPDTLADALDLIASSPDSGVVAGGTDLVVAARAGKRALPGRIVALHRLGEIAHRRVAGGHLELGALVSHAWIEKSETVRTMWSALADASALIGSPATRSTGTLGGNLMNASPAMDTGSPLIVLDAALTLQSSAGLRELSVGDLLTGPGQTSAAPDELLIAVRIPGLGARAGSAYVRLGHRRAMEIAIVGAAASVGLAEDGAVKRVRVAVSAVAPTCVEIRSIAGLRGSLPVAAAVDEFAQMAAREVDPISDVRATAKYRSAMTAVVVRRALTLALERASADVEDEDVGPSQMGEIA